jgi:anthranilate/para-aminobenzoate synthase component I
MTSRPPVRYFERSVPLSGDPLVAVSRLAAAGFHRDYVVYESEEQWSFASGVLAEISLDRAGARLRQVGITPEEVVLPWNGAPFEQVQTLLGRVVVAGWRAYGWAAFELAYATADGAEDYQRAVRRAVGEIRARRFQKVILSRIVPVEEDIDFVGTFVAGRRGNTPARSFLLHLGGIEAAGFSPEIVICVGPDGRVVSQPLAGTRVITDDPAENERLRTELLSDPKEVYEHAISIKTAYEELLDVCAEDSVVVEDFMTVRSRGSVQHLASRLVGQLAPGRPAWDAFAAAFPAVTASGVPKDAAYASIRTHEPQARGLYSGAVLVLDQDGGLDAALVLRAVYRCNGTTWMQAGAGIVSESRPEREFEETCEKLDSVARFLVPRNPSERQHDPVSQLVTQEQQ